MQHNIINYIVAALAKCDTVNYRQCSAVFVSIFSSWRFFCVSPAQNISISQIKPVRAQYNYKCYEPDFVRNCFVGSYSTFAFHTDTMAERWPGESLSARRVYECAINKTLKPKHVANTLMLYCVRPFDRKIISCYYYIFDLIWCRMEFHVSIVDCMAAQKVPVLPLKYQAFEKKRLSRDNQFFKNFMCTHSHHMEMRSHSIVISRVYFDWSILFRAYETNRE